MWPSNDSTPARTVLRSAPPKHYQSSVADWFDLMTPGPTPQRRLAFGAGRPRWIRAARGRLDPVGETGIDDACFAVDGLQAGFKPRAAELRQGRKALEHDHVRRNREKRPPILIDRV